MARGTVCAQYLDCGVISGSCTYTCNSGNYDANGLDSDGCENTTAAYIHTFQRYTFNLVAYTWTDVDGLDFCFEGKYASTGGTASANLQWYNVTAAAWVNVTAISTTEGTVCLTFSGANLTDIYNSTGTWVQFAARGNQSKQGDTNTLSGDYAYLSISYANPTAPWITGKSGNGISLNGTGVYGEANDSASLGITGQLTLEAWVNPSTVTPAYQTIVHKGTSPAENYGLYLEQDELYFEWINSGTRSTATTSANMQNNTWYHIAVVFNYSGNSVKLYVNGTQMASSSTPSDLLTDIGVLRIGANSSAGNYFNGTIDDVAIYSRAKSADEIAADANPIYVSTNIVDSLNNSISIRGSTSGYVNAGGNNTLYVKTSNGGFNMTAGAYSGMYSLRVYVNNTKANLLLNLVESGVSSIQVIIPVQLRISQQTFNTLVIAEK